MISAIILTFNSLKFIKSCLDSLFAQNYQSLEVIVIDNGSTDGTVDLIKINYPQLILIENKENLGATKARNQGIEISKGEWILTLDCDVVLHKDFLNNIMRLTEKSKKTVGIFQPKILKDDKRMIYSCGIYLSYLKRFYDIGKGKPDNGKFDKVKYIFGACSAAALYRRKMLQDIREDTGYFDERFFFLVEDVDLAWRAQRKDWKSRYCPEAACYHFGNSSYSNKQLRQYLCWRNRQIFLKKCTIKRFRLGIISLCYDFPRLVFLYLTNAYVHNSMSNKEVKFEPKLKAQI